MRNSNKRLPWRVAVCLISVLGCASVAHSGDAPIHISTWQCETSNPAVRIVIQNKKGTLFVEEHAALVLKVIRRDENGIWATVSGEKNGDGFLLQTDGWIFTGPKENPKKKTLCKANYSYQKILTR